MGIRTIAKRTTTVTCDGCGEDLGTYDPDAPRSLAKPPYDPPFLGLQLALVGDGMRRDQAFQLTGLGWQYKWMPPREDVTLILCPACASKHLQSLRPIVLHALNLDDQADSHGQWRKPSSHSEQSRPESTDSAS